MGALEQLTPEETAQFDAMRKGEAITTPDPAPASAPEPKAAEATPAPAPEPADDDEPKPDKSGMVPHGRFHEERTRRKAIEKALAEEKEKQAKLAGRFEILEQLAKQEQERNKAPANQDIQIPDLNADPVGHFKAQNEILTRQLTEMVKWRQSQDQNAQVQTNVQRISQIATTQEAEFKKTNPDYDDASNFLRNLEDARLQAMGVSDLAQRTQSINNSALQIAVGALQQGRSAAQAVYELAKASGWKPAVKAAETQAPNAAAAVEMAAAGQKQSGGIGTASGAAPAEITLDALANMPDDEFAKLTSGKNWQKLMTTAKVR